VRNITVSVFCALLIVIGIPVSKAWSNSLQLKFSSTGEVGDRGCLRLNEPSDTEAWSDNFLCADSSGGGENLLNLDLTWANSGDDFAQDCVQIWNPAIWSPGGNSNPSSDIGWHDNFLCVPYNSKYIFAFSGDEEVGARQQLPGGNTIKCVEFVEQNARNKWRNQHLCWRLRVNTDGLKRFFPRYLKMFRMQNSRFEGLKNGLKNSPHELIGAGGDVYQKPILLTTEIVNQLKEHIDKIKVEAFATTELEKIVTDLEVAIENSIKENSIAVRREILGKLCTSEDGRTAFGELCDGFSQ